MFLMNCKAKFKIFYSNFVLTHCVESAQIPSFFWSVFSHIWTEYGEIRTRKNSVFSPNAGKYGPEKTPYLETFHAVTAIGKTKFK